LKGCYRFTLVGRWQQRREMDGEKIGDAIDRKSGSAIKDK